MRMLWRRWLGLRDGIKRIALILLLTSVGGFCAGQEPQQDLPVVLDAAVPFYPRDAQLARIEGAVRLRISTDSETVSRVELLEGQPILARAAKENVKTWRLRWHVRITFEATFRYKLLPDMVCEADNSTVLLRLPLEVEVSAKGVKTCDPAVEIRPNGMAGNRCRESCSSRRRPGGSLHRTKDRRGMGGRFWSAQRGRRQVSAGLRSVIGAKGTLQYNSNRAQSVLRKRERAIKSANKLTISKEVRLRRTRL
jgi:hypothetical protein